MVALVEKCDHLQEYNLQHKNQVTTLQTHVVELQKKFGSFFKFIATLKKKNDDLNAALSAVHRKIRQESSFRTNEVEKFKFVVGRLEEELSLS